ncbi:hypothetical protein ACM67C_10935 [Bergeriella denitrificans]|nr:hypothetical protein [Bergeriella denitrificans]
MGEITNGAGKNTAGAAAVLLLIQATAKSDMGMPHRRIKAV